ncbi:MAG: immune inhibitor A, partial [Pseudonocardia sp.]|nr:immune inhibitor A [Pseudonocardia sp.]
QRRGSSTVVKVGTEEAAAGSSRARSRTEGSAGRIDQYVELSRETTDKIFVVLAEFGNERDPNYPDQDTDPTTPGPSRFDGPLHNEIPEPNRALDNSTVWQADYDRQHYQDLYFDTDPGVESVATYYDRQSSGRYTVEGTVTDWVKVRFNEARYGRSNGYPCASIVCNNTWNLVQDSVDQWTADQIASGKTAEQVAAELAEFDVWDRYDYDGDGNFDESDGYIDHFQIVHSGGDQADGDPYQGEDAIWSHRWYAFGTDQGATGPEFNLLGGAEVGDTNLWVGDYTIQPENGGISVFAHEYGHDLGLPDHYDLAGGENGVNWWTLMAQSRVDGAGDVGLGTRAADLSAWDKLQLGWFDYEIVVAGQRKRVELGPHEYNSAKAQGLVVVLPKKEVTSDLGAPAAGDFQWWSGSGDNLATTLQRTLDFTGKTSASMSLQARWDIEAEYDYLYAQASLDGGATWTSLDGTVNGEPFIRDASGAPALSGTQAEWADIEVPMDAVAGEVVEFRFLYRTDGGVAPIGFFADEIVITADGEPIVTDGAEDAPNGWTLDGFTAVGATQTQEFDNYYLASYRNYVSYDQYLQTGPYNFGFANTRPDFLERFPYQDGLLISYWDTSYSDNNTSEHPGEGEVLVIDANPEPRYRLDGGMWRPRVAGYDAPFGLQKSDSFSLNFNGQSSYLRGQPAKPTFDDTKKYWYEEQPGAGVKVPATGTVIRVVKQEGTSMTVQVSSRR